MERQQGPYLLPPPQEIPQRVLNGPVPKRPIGNHRTIQADPTLHSLSIEAALAFLTPVETQILALIMSTKRCSHFRPVLEPNSPILLVQPNDKKSLQNIRDLVRDLTEFEKAQIERDLKSHLLPQQRYVLSLMLGDTKVLVTTHTRGMKMEAEEGFQRPDSIAMFGPWRREWEDGPNPNSRFRSVTIEEDGDADEDESQYL